MVSIVFSSAILPRTRYGMTESGAPVVVQFGASETRFLGETGFLLPNSTMHAIRDDGKRRPGIQPARAIPVSRKMLFFDFGFEPMLGSLDLVWGGLGTVVRSHAPRAILAYIFKHPL